MSIAVGTKSVTNFNEVLTRVKAAGLMNKKPSFYMIRLAVISALASGLWTAGAFIGQAFNENPVWIIAGFAVAGLLGVLSAQYGFIAHEAAHRQVFRGNKANDWLGLILANLFAGLSYGFWMKKHNQHHKVPNQIDADPDIAIRILSFTPESRNAKKGVERWLSERQGYLFPFLLFLTGFDLLLDSFAGLVRKDKPLQTRLLEFGLMFARQHLTLPWALSLVGSGPLRSGSSK
jgi:fatty acid desaturase